MSEFSVTLSNGRQLYVDDIEIKDGCMYLKESVTGKNDNKMMVTISRIPTTDVVCIGHKTIKGMPKCEPVGFDMCQMEKMKTDDFKNLKTIEDRLMETLTASQIDDVLVYMRALLSESEYIATIFNSKDLHAVNMRNVFGCCGAKIGVRNLKSFTIERLEILARRAKRNDNGAIQ